MLRLACDPRSFLPPILRVMRIPLTALTLVAFLLLSACADQPIHPNPEQVTETGFFEVPGGSVFYEISNPEAEGIPLVLIHGGPGGTSCGFGFFDNHILDRPVIRYDQLETGRSDRPGLREQWNISHSVTELEALRAHFNLDELHLMGWSWGGAVAAEYALEGQSGGVLSLVMAGPLLSTPIWIEDANYLVGTMPEDLRDTIRRYEELEQYDHPDYLAATDSFYARFMNPYSQTRPPECDGVSGNGEVYNTMWGPTEFTSTGTLLTYDRSDRLGEIDMPVYLIAGEFDEARPVTMERFAEMIPVAKTAVVEGTGHAAPAERPEYYADLVSAWLDDVESGALGGTTDDSTN